MLRRRSDIEPVAQGRLLIFVIRRVPLYLGWVAVEEVRHEDLVGVLGVAVGEDVGALERLRKEAEDVVDRKDSAVGCGGARYVWEERVSAVFGGRRLVIEGGTNRFWCR